MPHALQMSAADTGLLVIDVQEKLLPLILDRDAMVRNIGFLIDVARLLEMTVQATEQYPRGLGPTTPELARRLGLKDESGVVVTEVKPDSPAAQAGLASGDVIREVNRLPVRGLDDIEKGMGRGGGGAKQVLLRVEREGNQRYIVVELG